MRSSNSSRYWRRSSAVAPAPVAAQNPLADGGDGEAVVEKGAEAPDALGPRDLGPGQDLDGVLPHGGDEVAGRRLELAGGNRRNPDQQADEAGAEELSHGHGYRVRETSSSSSKDGPPLRPGAGTLADERPFEISSARRWR